MYSHDYKSTWQTYIYLLNESWLQTESFKDFTTYIWHEDSLLPSVLWVKPWEYLCKMDLHLNDRTLWLKQIHEASNVTVHISHVWKGLLFTLCTLKFSIWNKNKITYSNFSVLFIIDYDVIESQWWISQLTVKKTSVCMFFPLFFNFSQLLIIKANSYMCSFVKSQCLSKAEVQFFFLNLISTQQTSVHYQIGIVLLFHAMWFRYRI